MSGLGITSGFDSGLGGMISTGIGGSEMSEQEVLSSMQRGHSSLMSVLLRRTRGLQVNIFHFG